MAAPRSLRRQWSTGGLVGAAGLALFAWGLARGTDLSPFGWGLAAGATWLYQWIFVRGRLGEHRTEPRAPVLNRLGPGTILSAVRGWCLAALAGFLFVAEPEGFSAWLPMILYTTADIADYWDGYLARRSGTDTALGVALDMELDALGLLTAVTLAIQLGKLPWLFLPIGLARYGFAYLEWMRRRTGRIVHELPPSVSRRPIAGLTMGYMSTTLWPILDRPELTLAGGMFFLPFAASFLRDGAAVSGVLNPQSPAYLKARKLAIRLLLRWLPLALRAGLAAFMIVEGSRLMMGAGPLVESLRQFGFAQPDRARWVLAAALLPLSAACVVGAAGRFAAFLSLFPLTILIAAADLDPWRAVGLVVTTGLLMAGTGVASLWSPSDRVFRQRAGEQETSAAEEVLPASRT